jgi:hypothetical protein
MLGLETGEEVEVFTMRAGVPFDYTLDDIQSDAETSQHLKENRVKESHGR